MNINRCYLLLSIEVTDGIVFGGSCQRDQFAAFLFHPSLHAAGLHPLSQTAVRLSTQTRGSTSSFIDPEGMNFALALDWNKATTGDLNLGPLFTQQVGTYSGTMNAILFGIAFHATCRIDRISEQAVARVSCSHYISYDGTRVKSHWVSCRRVSTDR